ncbi:MAG: hypothetical protein IIY06_05480 [Proteobacteria bacterium]|nr:hypothetical protein [Pseudomonadota bacterium]
MKASIRYLYIPMLAALLMCSNATAKDRTPEPQGIETNGFILHFGADLSLGVDSVDNSTITSTDGLIDVGAHFSTKRADSDIHAWSNNIRFNWKEYFGLGLHDNPDGGPFVSISSSADLFKKSLFRLTPSVTYRFTSDAEDTNQHTVPDNHLVKLGTYLTIQPGSGAIFSERIGYHFTGTIYPDQDSITYFDHRIDSYTRWNFLPRTHMALLFDFHVVHFKNDTRKGNVDGSTSERKNPFGLPIRLKYSLGGLITETLSYDIGAGYAFIYYDPGTKKHSWLLNAKLRYDIRPNVGLGLEYKKDFETSPYADYYNYHRIAFDFDALWIDRIETTASVSCGFYDYQTDFITNADVVARKDTIISANLGIFYNFMPGLRLGVKYSFRDNISDYDLASYEKHKAAIEFTYEY